MTDDGFHKLLAAIEALTAAQLTALDAAIRGRLGAAGAPPGAAAEDAGEPRSDCASVADIEARFAAKPLCPRCQSTKVAKWGSANCLKRYHLKIAACLALETAALLHPVDVAIDVKLQMN